jgi:RNA polymerase sigma-70 factor (ECF subfamily)
MNWPPSPEGIKNPVNGYEECRARKSGYSGRGVGKVSLVRLFAKPENPLKQQFEASALTHLDALYANALHLTRSAVDAEDLVQDTLLKAFRFFESFEQGTNLKAWLFRIQYNTFVNLYRRAAKQSAVTDASNWSSLAGDFLGEESLRALTDPEREAFRPLVAREIGRAFDELSDDYRAILLLADVEEYSYREIADVLGCPLGTVMSRLHRARRALRRVLHEMAGEPPALKIGSEAEEGAEAAEAVDNGPVSLDDFRRSRSGR